MHKPEVAFLMTLVCLLLATSCLGVITRETCYRSLLPARYSTNSSYMYNALSCDITDTEHRGIHLVSCPVSPHYSIGVVIGRNCNASSVDLTHGGESTRRMVTPHAEVWRWYTTSCSTYGQPHGISDIFPGVPTDVARIVYNLSLHDEQGTTVDCSSSEIYPAAVKPVPRLTDVM